MHKLERRTIVWATQKGIIGKGNKLTQALKLMSEVGELADALDKNNKAEVQDAVGDICVVLTSLAYLSNSETISHTIHLTMGNKIVDVVLGELAEAVIKDKDLTTHISDMLAYLTRVVNIYGFTINDCWESALDIIEQRTGHINGNGDFIKATPSPVAACTNVPTYAGSISTSGDFTQEGSEC